MKLRPKQMTVEKMTVEQLQNEMANQHSELKTKPTVLAAAMQGLQMDSGFSSSEHSQDSQQSQDLEGNKLAFEQNLIDEYSELDAFTKQTNSENDSETGEVESEELSPEDAADAAAFFVDTGAGFVESLFDYPVTIDNDTKQAIAQKAVPVVIKNSRGMKLPPWVIAYREELELLAVVSMAGFSIWKQIKLAKAEELKAEKAAKKSEYKFNETGEVVASGN